MALRKIRTEEDPILLKTSREVTEFDDRLFELLEDMKETLGKADGIGLAAVQIGVLRRVVVIKNGEEFVELINPRITSSRGEQFETEACLSLPGKAGKTKRPAFVKVKAFDRTGKKHIYSGTELMARCFCHELDHLDGVLYPQRLAEGETLVLTEDE